MSRFSVETVFNGKDETSPVISAIQAKARAAAKDFHPGEQAVGFADKGVDAFKMVGAAAVGAGVAGGIALASIIETGVDFEHSITGVGAVMGKSRGQIEDLEKAALSLGVTTQFSASEVADAMEQMARKGFDSEEILKGIPGVLDAVAASGEGMAEVSTVVGSSIRGFGLDAKDATHVADVLAFTSEKVGAKITDLGAALATAAPTASALGVSIEDTAAAVGLLQKMGIDASTSGSAVATMLAKISKPSKGAAQQMAAMGISFKDAQGDMLPLRDVIGQFVKAGDKAGGNMNKMAFFAELVGLRGDKAALGLEHMVKAGEFDKLTEGLEHVDGAAHKVAMMKLDDTHGSWKLLGSTVEVLAIKFSKLTNGGLKDAIDKTNAWVAANSDLMIDKVSGFAETLTNDVKFLADNIDTGTTVLGKFKDGLFATFQDSSQVKLFGSVLSKVFGDPGDKESPGARAMMLGMHVGDLMFMMGDFIIVTKAAQAAIWLWGAAAKTVQAVTWLWNAALAAGRWLIGSYGVAAQVGAANTVAFGGAMTAATMSAGELAVAEDAATIATAELAAAETAASVAGGRFAAMRGALNSTFSSVASQAGLAAGAIGAVYLAYDQFKSFEAENGGWEGVKAFVGAGDDPTEFGPDAVIHMQDRKARAQAALRPDGPPVSGATPGAARAYDTLGGVAAPGSYAEAFGFQPPIGPPAPPQVVATGSQSDAQAKTNEQLQQTLAQLVPQLSGAMKGTLTIKLPPGATGYLDGGGGGINLEPSGGFN